jgi:hypothetical protein
VGGRDTSETLGATVTAKNHPRWTQLVRFGRRRQTGEVGLHIDGRSSKR